MMCARLGLVTGEGLGKVFKRKFPRSAVAAVCGALFIANTINIAADLSGMAAAGEMVSGVNAAILVPLSGAAIACAMVYYRYEHIAAILKWLVLSLFAYVATAFLVHPPWGEVAKATFLPELPQGAKVWQSIVGAARHHDQSVSVLLAGIPGGRGGRGERPVARFTADPRDQDATFGPHRRRRSWWFSVQHDHVFGDRTIMKTQTSSILHRVVVGITTAAMFAATLAMFYGIWHGDM